MSYQNYAYDGLFTPHAQSNTPFLRHVEGTVWFHSAFYLRTAQLCEVLRDWGLKPGDRVAVQSCKSAEALVVYAACLRGGFVYFPLSPLLLPADRIQLLRHAGVGLFVTDAAAGEPPALSIPCLSLPDLIAQASGYRVSPPSPRVADDLAAIICPQGGTPHGEIIKLRHRDMLDRPRDIAQTCQWRAKDVLLHSLPVTEASQLLSAMHVTLVAGASMIFLPCTDLELLSREMSRATTMIALPELYDRLLQDPNLTAEQVPNIRLFLSGTASLPPDLQTRWSARMGRDIRMCQSMISTPDSP